MTLQVVTQQELLYNVDFRLQMMERQVARAAGTRSDEETKQLNAKIGKLTEALEGVNAEHAMLTAQVKKAEEDLSECCFCHIVLCCAVLCCAVLCCAGYALLIIAQVKKAEEDLSECCF